MKKYFAVVVLFSTIIYACSEATQEQQNKETSQTTESETINSEQIKELGVNITSQLQQVLAGQLKRAIQDSGIVHALKYCNLQAYPLTDSISDQFNVRIKRLSHKVRNLNNMLSFNEAEVFGNFQRQLTEGKLLEPTIEETTDRFTYFAPIMVMVPLCLKCHGMPKQDIAPEDFIVINMLYPEDNATGFRLNDLRGMWRIDFDKSALVQ